MSLIHTLRLASFLLVGTLAVSGCSVFGNGKTETEDDQLKRDMYRNGSLVSAEGGLNLFGKGKRGADQGDPNGLGVNSFLWRASLDTLAFMPIVSADPFGGVILTDWYSPPDTPNERFKVNLYIMDRQLRADGVRVSVFRQQRDGNGWRDAPVASDTAGTLEDAVLTRARQLRVAQSASAQ